jgi:alanine dehydrogenase
VKTLFLTASDVSALVHEADAYEAVKEAFQAYAGGRAQMPPKVYLDLPEYRGDFRAMPAHIENLKACGLKWVNSHPENIKTGKFPAVMGILILSDPESGFPLSVMDATVITRLRTGAAGALASVFLARPDSKILSLVGCGIQAEAQFLAHIAKFTFSEVRVWGHEISLARKFQEKMGKYHTNIVLHESIESCVRKADIVCTTTPVRKPIVEKEWISPGTHINAIGADAQGKQELDVQIIQKGILVVDDIEQSMHGGEINVGVSQGMLKHQNIHATLGEITAGLKKGRNSSKDITIFDSTGLAIQDMALGKRIYTKALEKKAGLFLDFI